MYIKKTKNRSFTNKYGTIVQFMVTFFMRFEGKQIKKVDEANKTIASFSILIRVLIVLLVSYVHMETST